MSSVAICTDSSALLPAGDVERLDLSVVPIAIALDGEPFDEQTHEIDDFYALLFAGAKATTAQPSPGEFLVAYASAAAGGATEVLSIHLDARVSGAIGAAELAAREAAIPVTVVDTGTVSFGVGACVREAARAVVAGTSTREAAAAARLLGAEMQNVFVARGGGGRVRGEPGWAALTFVDGKTEVLVQCESVDEVVGIMAAGVLRGARSIRVAVGHAAEAIRPAADALAETLASASQVMEVERYRVGAAVGAHTGPLSFGAFWWPAE